MDKNLRKKIVKIVENSRNGKKKQEEMKELVGEKVIPDDILQQEMINFVNKVCPLDENDNPMSLPKEYEGAVRDGVDNLAVVVMVVERIGKKPIALRKVGRMGTADTFYMWQALGKKFF